MKGKRLILASNSPRRRELLKGLDIDFVVDTQNNFEENFSADTPHPEVPALMSRGKSHGFHRPLEKDEIEARIRECAAKLPETADMIRRGETLRSRHIWLWEKLVCSGGQSCAQ